MIRHEPGAFAGELVAIENASGARDLRQLEPEKNWCPAPLEMEDFSIPRAVQEACPQSCPQYAAELLGVRVIAGMSVILDMRNGEVISDSVYRRRADIHVEWYQMYGLDLSEPRRATVSRRSSGPPLRVARAVCLFSWENRNYAHWLIEKLASLHWIGSAGLPPDAKLLVEAGLPSSIVESLRLMWPPEHTIFVDRGESVDVDHLYYFSDSAEIWEPRTGYVYSGTDYRVCPEALRWLSGTVRERVTSTGRKPVRRAYLERPPSGIGRNVVNQADLMEMLGRHRFVRVQPANMGFAEQVGLFAGAELIVSPSGAALTNMLWMSPGSVAVILIQDSPRVWYWFFHSLAAALGIRLINFPIRSVPIYGRPIFHWDTEVPVQELSKWLGRVFPAEAMSA